MRLAQRGSTVPVLPAAVAQVTLDCSKGQRRRNAIAKMLVDYYIIDIDVHRLSLARVWPRPNMGDNRTTGDKEEARHIRIH
jgi:hypothetical protein